MAGVALVDPALLRSSDSQDVAVAEALLQQWKRQQQQLASQQELADAPRDAKGKPILTPAQQAQKKALDKEKSQRRNKALLALLWRALLIAIFVGIVAAAVYSFTAWIAGGRISWRNVLAASVGSAFLTFALTFAIASVQIFQQP